jgi:hypothetical protein
MDQTVGIAFVFKQKVDECVSLIGFDFIEKIGMIFLEVFLDKAAFADFKGFQVKDRQILGGKIIFQKGSGVFKIAPDFLEQLVMGTKYVVYGLTHAR